MHVFVEMESISGKDQGEFAVVEKLSGSKAKKRDASRDVQASSRNILVAIIEASVALHIISYMRAHLRICTND